MIEYVCDTCSAMKKAKETWIVGLAAEAVGVTSARREANIESAWSRETAVHPLAVHFCSIQCKDEYMARLFAPEAAVEATPVEEVVVKRRAPTEVVIAPTVLAKERLPRKEKVVIKTGSRSKSAA